MNRLIIVFLFLLLSIVSAWSDEPNITISGEIDEKLKLKYSVGYRTTKESIWCQDYIILAGIWVDETESFLYDVEKKDGKYSIKIPLNEKKNDSFCGWEPYIIMFNINHDSFSDLKNTLYRGLVSVWDDSYKPATNTKMIACSPKIRKYNRGKYLRCIMQGDIDELSTAILKGQTNLTVHFYFNEKDKQGE